jgi:hypothetical protein
MGIRRWTFNPRPGAQAGLSREGSKAYLLLLVRLDDGEQAQSLLNRAVIGPDVCDVIGKQITSFLSLRRSPFYGVQCPLVPMAGSVGLLGPFDFTVEWSQLGIFLMDHGSFGRGIPVVAIYWIEFVA